MSCEQHVTICRVFCSSSYLASPSTIQVFSLWSSVFKPAILFPWSSLSAQDLACSCTEKVKETEGSFHDILQSHLPTCAHCASVTCGPSMVIQVCSSVKPRFPSCPSFHSSSLLRNIPQSVFCISCASWIFSFRKIIEVSIQSSLNFLRNQWNIFFGSHICLSVHTFVRSSLIFLCNPALQCCLKSISPEFLGFLFQCSCFLLILTLLPDSYLKGKSQKYHHIRSKSSIWLN